MTKRAVTYARVSGDDRRTEGRNIEGQLKMYQEFCQEKGYSIIAELAEDEKGASGADLDLPMLNQALEMAGAGEFDVLVTRELDRLARGLAKQLVVEEEFKRHGITIEYVLGEYPDTIEGNLHKNIRAVIAEYDRLKIAERLVRGRRQVVKSGKVMLHGNKPPFGYRVKDGILIIHEPEARIVRLIFTWYVVGDETGKRLSGRPIADKLSQLKVPTWADTHGGKKVRDYGQWSGRQILNLLDCETYGGTWHYGKKNYHTGQVNPREHWLSLDVPPIVSRELWERAQQQRQANKVVTRYAKNEYLLGGKVRCGMCGSSVCGYSSVVRNKNYKYYRCSATSARGLAGTTCDIPSFRVEEVDAAIWEEYLKPLLLHPDQLQERLEQQKNELREKIKPYHDRVCIIDDLLEEQRRQLKRLLDLYLAGTHTQDLLAEKQGLLEKTIADLEREKVVLTAAAYETQRFLTQDQVRTIEGIAKKLAKELEVADVDFAARRKLVDVLGVQVRLLIEDGQKAARVWCPIGEGLTLSLSGGTTQSGAQSSQAFVIGTTLRLASNEPGELFTHLLTTPTGAGLSGRSI